MPTAQPDSASSTGSPPELWLLAGGNGAGKSYFYQTYLAPLGLIFVNADQIARQIWPDEPEIHSYEAALLAERERERLLTEGATFCFETVYSHPSKIDFLARAKAFGYVLKIFYIHLSRPDLNLARVYTRVGGGGHDVPEEKVRARIPRSLENIAHTVALADELHLLDNSSSDNPYVRVASWVGAQWGGMSTPLPDWAAYIVDSPPRPGD